MTLVTTTDVVNGTTSDANIMNNNFTNVKAVVNGQLDNSNIASAAAVAVSKLAAGSNGQILKVVAGAPTWSTATGVTSYATTLPASPTDGEEAILVDSLTAPTYVWRFRFNSGNAGSYKWEFVGGTAARVITTALEDTASASYTNLTTTGPTFAIPRVGIYEVTASFSGQRSGDGHCVMSYELGATVASDDWCAGGFLWNASPGGFSRVARHTVASVPLTITAKYKTVAATARFSQRALDIRPIQVG